jgi:hypothetical protein
MTTFSKELEAAYQKARAVQFVLAEAEAKRNREHRAWADSGDGPEGPKYRAAFDASTHYEAILRQLSWAGSDFYSLLRTELFPPPAKNG